MGKESSLNKNKYQAIWSKKKTKNKNNKTTKITTSIIASSRSGGQEVVDEGTATAVASQTRKVSQLERQREEQIEKNESFFRSLGIQQLGRDTSIRSSRSTSVRQLKKDNKDLSPTKRRSLRSSSIKLPPLKTIDESSSRRQYRERISCPYRNLGCLKRVYILDGSTAAIAFAKHILNGCCDVKKVKFPNGNLNEVQIVNVHEEKEDSDLGRGGYKPKYYPIGKLDVRSYSPRNDDEFQDHNDLIDEEEEDDIPEEKYVLNYLSKILIDEMPGLMEAQIPESGRSENIDEVVIPASFHLHFSIADFIKDELKKADYNEKEHPDTSIIQHQGKWLAVFDTSDVKIALPQRTSSKREDLIDLYACQAQLGLSGKTEGKILLNTISNIVDRNVKTINDYNEQLLNGLNRKLTRKIVNRSPKVHIPNDMRSVRQACTVNFDPLNHITVQNYFYPEKFFGKTFKAKQLKACTGASSDIMEVLAYALLNIDPEKINLEATRSISPLNGDRIYGSFHTGDLANKVFNHYKNMRGRGEENAYPLFIALQFDTASASTARTRDQCPVSIQILNCPEKQTHLVGFAPIHDAYSIRELREILIRRGCKVTYRQKSIIKLFKNQRVNRFLYDIMEPTLSTHERGVLAQIGRGSKARHVKLYVHVVKIIGDIVALNGCTSTSFQKTKLLTRRCRICMATNLHGSFDLGELRKNDETDRLSKGLEVILTKQFTFDIDQRKGKGKYRKSQEEQQVMKRANLLGILAGTNPVIKMFEFLFDLDLHSFHEGIGPDILHVFKLGVLRNIVAWTIEIMENLSKLERLLSGTDKLEHALPLVDGYLKAFPISKSMQTWHPVRPIRFNNGITFYIRSQTDDGNTTGGYLTTMYGYMYPSLAFQLMFIIANDVNGNILPRDTNINNRLLNSSVIKKSISAMCLDALAAAVEVHMFLEREEYLDADLSCLDSLIRNLRIHYTYLFKLRSDVLKLAKSGRDDESQDNDEEEALENIVDMEFDNDDEEKAESEEESPQGEDQVLFSMKEVKSHYMAHMIADIKLFGGQRSFRDTEDTEFSMKPFLKDLWPVISKRFGTDKKELLRRHFENRYAMDLQNQFVHNENESAVQCKQSVMSAPSVIKHGLQIYHGNYLTSSHDFMHQWCRQRHIEEKLEAFMQLKYRLNDEVLSKVAMLWLRWKNNMQGYVCKLIKEHRIVDSRGNFMLYANKNHGIDRGSYMDEREAQEAETVPIFSVIEVEIESNGVESITVVARVVAILGFEHLDSRTKDVMLAIVVMSTNRQSSSSNAHSLPFDTCKAQWIKNGYFTQCIHISAVKGPVFCIAKEPQHITRHNEVNNLAVSFYVIPMSRWTTNKTTNQKGKSYLEDYQNEWSSCSSCFKSLEFIDSFK